MLLIYLVKDEFSVSDFISLFYKSVIYSEKSIPNKK